MVVKLEQSTAWPPEGPVRVFQTPMASHSYVMGADVAEGLEHGDYSAAHVLDRENGLLVATWHDHTDPDLFGEQIALLGRYYNTALIGVEINNHGHVTVNSLRRLNYPRLFRRRVVGQINEGFAPQYGWLTNKVSKPIMIEGLNSAIRDGSLDIRDEQTLAECRTYIREYTTGGGVKMHGSPFDDRVMSLAIAVQMLAYTHEDLEDEQPDDYLTLDWWSRTIDDDATRREQSTVAMIGAHSVRRTN